MGLGLMGLLGTILHSSTLHPAWVLHKPTIVVVFGSQGFGLRVLQLYSTF